MTMNYQRLIDRIRRAVDTNPRFDQKDKQEIKVLAVKAIWDEMDMAKIELMHVQTQVGDVHIQLSDELNLKNK